MSQAGANSNTGSGASVVETLTGNSGGAVGPDGTFNIDILGNNATGIDVVGTPASNLLTILGLPSSETQVGTIEIATDAETIAGTDTERAVVPSSLAAKLGSQTADGIPYATGTSAALGWTSGLTNGQLVIGSTAGVPAAANLTSTGASIAITNGANSINLETASTVAIQFNTDSGNAIPSSGIIEILGGTGISTSGASNTVTVTLDTPVAVAEGGTGATSLTDHAVLIGSGTGAITPVGPVAATGALLASNGVGSDPGFTTATYPLTTTANQILFSSATNTVSEITTANDGALITSAAGVPSISSTLPSAVQGNITSVGTITSGTWNGTDIAVADGGTGLSSTTAYAVICGGTTSTNPLQSIAGVGSAGEVLTSNGAGALPTFQAASGGVTGPGSSTDNALARWNGTGGTAIQDSTVIVTNNGEMTNASQPAFLAYLGTADNNQTGNSTVYTLGSGNALTEAFDQGGDFVTSGTFTAPVTGRYHLGSSFVISDIGAGMTFAIFALVTSNASYINGFFNADAIETVAAAPDIIGNTMDIFADMDAADTFTTTARIDGGAGDTADISASGRRVNIYGYLVC